MTTSGKKPRRPFSVKAINFVGRLMDSIGIGSGPFDVAKLQRKATADTGLDDFGPEGFLPGLNAYVDALNDNESLHPLGRKLTEDSIVRRLTTRLKAQQTLQEYPSLKAITLERPVFLVGTARSGTTFLYNLLALDAAFRAPSYWEVVDPMPPASVVGPERIEARIAKIEKTDVAGYNRLLPDHRQIHHFRSARQKEECLHLMETTFRFNSLGLLYGRLPGYMAWLDAEPRDTMLDAYREFEILVRGLMHGNDGKTWLSKSPGHAMHLPEMAEVFPDAIFVHTHRNPSERIVSHANLFYVLQSLFFDPVPSAESMGELSLLYNHRSMDGIERARSNPSIEDRTFDINYENLIQDPVSSIASLYAAMGREMTDAYTRTLEDWLKNKNFWSQKRVGRHEYNADTFGLDVSELGKLNP